MKEGAGSLVSSRQIRIVLSDEPDTTRDESDEKMTASTAAVWPTRGGTITSSGGSSIGGSNPGVRSNGPRNRARLGKCPSPKRRKTLRDSTSKIEMVRSNDPTARYFRHRDSDSVRVFCARLCASSTMGAKGRRSHSAIFRNGRKPAAAPLLPQADPEHSLSSSGASRSAHTR